MIRRPGPPARSIAALALAAAAMLAVGCDGNGRVLGYTSGELYPEDVRTVAVEIFESRPFDQGVEFDLTEAVVKEIELRTPYKVVARSGADTALDATITDVDRRLLSRTPEAGIPQEVQVTVTLSFEWKDLRSGQVLRKRSRLSGTGEFIPTRGVGEFYEHAQHEAVAEIARDIVSVMRRDW